MRIVEAGVAQPREAAPPGRGSKTVVTEKKRIHPAPAKQTIRARTVAQQCPPKQQCWAFTREGGFLSFSFPSIRGVTLCMGIISNNCKQLMMRSCAMAPMHIDRRPSGRRIHALRLPCQKCTSQLLCMIMFGKVVSILEAALGDHWHVTCFSGPISNWLFFRKPKGWTPLSTSTQAVEAALRTFCCGGSLGGLRIVSCFVAGPWPQLREVPGA